MRGRIFRSFFALCHNIAVTGDEQAGVIDLILALDLARATHWYTAGTDLLKGVESLQTVWKNLETLRNCDAVRVNS